ncbi:LTA synthase family protein [Desulfovibrio sulfodismutans]|uniref:LTA synthase family protein n=1 Tax=Desulfolutivibrio sulfodismutans TaxID=63561 RepID=A0A7K3NK39_9BACT|nr:LTA synthase family protein [Desulfolutivibrio sulfodismutans]NDY56487.1 LTA synthase family protein [Desulfolutivibrio sulfodismutans]QLA12777.1 sulfatase-like hydrolase/transferase [Desulfolutivibrio sulfodismutans DSM 3696]
MILGLMGLLAAVAASLLVHRVDAVAHRSKPLDAVIDGPVIIVSGMGYLGFLAVSGRPAFSLILMAGGTVLLSVVNRLKHRLFREPIVFLDAALTLQVMRHPGFYVPYLFPAPVLAAGAVAAVVMAVLWGVEPPVDFSARLAAVLGIAAGLAVCALLATLFFPARRDAALRLLKRYPPSLSANADFSRYGLLCSFFLHGLWHVHQRGQGGNPGIPRFQATPAAVPAATANLPHLVLIQAESFFDVRRHMPDAPAELLPHYDRLRAEGTGGLFQVQTHGAYTMRTEFSVLTGLALETLGTDAFNPYFTASRHRVDSLAWRLRALGYRTACIHPFFLSFFQRNRVLPNLGFETLYGQEFFPGDSRCGPFVSDAALSRFVLDWLAASREPAFVFVITMEAHGPWKPGRLAHEPGAKDVADRPMDIYLHHLRHTDAMFGTMADGLCGLDRPAALCAYGDHVGCLPALHQPRDMGYAATDWVLWPTPMAGAGSTRSLRPEEIGGVMWDVALGKGRR